MRKRVFVEWNLGAINRPSIILTDPDDGELWVGLSWGDSYYSDPVWSVQVRLSGFIARPFMAWAGWRWDRDVRKQNARRAA